MNLKKILWIVLGFIGLALGALGAILPIMPSFPFLMLALFSFGKSSDRLHTWFKTTNLYKNNLESFVKGKGMTGKTKLKIILTVTFVMALSFLLMLGKNLYVPCIILVLIWISHIIYFIFGVKEYGEIDDGE
ncbi:YbaN family protein [Peptoniphilaceae bacterium SGI.131]